MRSTSGVSLAGLICAPRRDIDEIALYLDALDESACMAALMQLGRVEQRALYEKASASKSLQPVELVESAGELQEVIHEGVNTLPAPRPLRRFQKRFCRPPRNGDCLYGFNEGPTRRVIGPGYFVARSTAGLPRWESRGGVVVDYFVVPKGPVPTSWPPIVSNDTGLQRFVFRHTRDFLRRVSSRVTIGAAYKNERPLDHYFVLFRTPGSWLEPEAPR